MGCVASWQERQIAMARFQERFKVHVGVKEAHDLPIQRWLRPLGGLVPAHGSAQWRSGSKPRPRSSALPPPPSTRSDTATFTGAPAHSAGAPRASAAAAAAPALDAATVTPVTVIAAKPPPPTPTVQTGPVPPCHLHPRGWLLWLRRARGRLSRCQRLQQPRWRARLRHGLRSR